MHFTQGGITAGWGFYYADCARTPVASPPLVMAGSVVVVSQYLESYKEFRPRQRPASFTIDQAMEKLKQGLAH